MSTALATLVTTHRTRLGLSQNGLAREIPCDPAFVNRVEKGATLMTLLTAARFAEVLGVAPLTLILAIAADQGVGKASQRDVWGELEAAVLLG